MDVKRRPVCQHSLGYVKDPLVSFAKSRRAIAGTMNKIKIISLTSRGHYISSTVASSTNDATPQSGAAYERRIEGIQTWFIILFLFIGLKYLKMKKFQDLMTILCL